jgi:hypothetical protein
MDHVLLELCFLPCFTSVSIICVLVQCCHSWGIGVLLEDLDRGNISLPFILNSFHHGAFRTVLYFGNGSYMYNKRHVVHSPMRIRARMLRLMQLLEKMNKK